MQDGNFNVMNELRIFLSLESLERAEGFEREENALEGA